LMLISHHGLGKDTEEHIDDCVEKIETIPDGEQIVELD